MPYAPTRGKRKCGTCAFYTHKLDEWEKDCKLAVCECLAQDKHFGRALCKNYMSRVYLDMSNHGDIGGQATGYCEWKCPPILRKLLWDQFQYRLVNADASWCHCWTSLGKVTELPGFVALIEAGTPKQLVKKKA